MSNLYEIRHFTLELTDGTTISAVECVDEKHVSYFVTEAGEPAAQTGPNEYRLQWSDRTGREATPRSKKKSGLVRRLLRQCDES
jgi:hypothetical protein